MTDIRPHRFISATRIETGDPVLVVTTKLNLNSDNPAYNKADLDELSQHVSAWQQENYHRATIEGPV